YRTDQKHERLALATHALIAVAAVGAAFGSIAHAVHLAATLALLRVAAPAVEKRLGKAGLLAIALVGAAFPGLSLGALANGATAATLGALTALFPRARVRWLYWAVALVG